MFNTSLSASVAVMFKLNGCKLVYKSDVGKTIVGVFGGVFATVIIVSLVLKLPEVSLALAVKLITLPFVTLIVMFWLNTPVVASFNEKLKYCL